MNKRAVVLTIVFVLVIAITAVIVHQPKSRMNEQIYIDLETMLYPHFQTHTLKNYPDMAKEVREEPIKLLERIKADDQFKILHKMDMQELYFEELTRSGLKNDPIVVHDYNAFPWSYKKNYTTEYFSHRWSFDYNQIFKSIIATAQQYKVVPSEFSREVKTLVIRRAICSIYK